MSDKVVFENVSIVLHRPRFPENIGAAARAMRNMGINQLVVVDPLNFDLGKVLKMATHAASDVVEQIKIFEKLEGSISELSYFLGDIGIAAINSDSKNTLDEVIKTLTYIGGRAIDNNLIHSISHILKNLWIIGKESTQTLHQAEHPRRDIDRHSRASQCDA